MITVSAPEDTLQGALAALPPLRDVIAAHELNAQKSLGQNFLLDQNITDKIARYAGDVEDFSTATIFEIGPGPGGLTRSLLKACAKKVIAIEFDPRAIKALGSLVDAAEDRLTLLHADAMDADLKTLSNAPRMIIANLPYNIATPLIIKWLKEIYNDHETYKSMTLMVQKEVAQRITSAHGSKTYGRLSVLCQWLCNTKRLFDLPPAAFTPPPKVTSSVVKFLPKELGTDKALFENIERVTAAAFGQRRKMIRSSLKQYLPQLEELGIDTTLRAENLSVENYVGLAKIIK